jgi:cytochrome c oxidase assembly protein subunit 15
MSRAVNEAFNDEIRAPKPGYKLALLACALACVVIVLGAFTRLKDAGLGCPDWPTCYGHLWVPNEAHEIAAANEKFADTPVEVHKTWPEQTHRIFASSLGLLGIGILILAIRRRDAGHPWRSIVALLALLVAGTVARATLGRVMDPVQAAHLVDPVLGLLAGIYFANLAWLAHRHGTSQSSLKLPAFIAGFLVLQGLFGMWTVTLKVWPQVVTAHLLGGFTMLSVLWLLQLRLQNRPWQLQAQEWTRLQSLKTFALLALVVVIVQIALGGWTASNYAAVACPDFPTCQAQWLPPTNFHDAFNFSQHIGPNYLGGKLDNDARVTIHLMHRLGAIVTTLVLATLIVQGLRAAVSSRARNQFILVAVILLLQLLLGVGNVVLHFPLHVTVSHNAVGALLLLTMVTLNYRLFTCEKVAEPSEKHAGETP